MEATLNLKAGMNTPHLSETELDGSADSDSDMERTNWPEPCPNRAFVAGIVPELKLMNLGDSWSLYEDMDTSPEAKVNDNNDDNTNKIDTKAVRYCLHFLLLYIIFEWT